MPRHLTLITAVALVVIAACSSSPGSTRAPGATEDAPQVLGTDTPDAAGLVAEAVVLKDRKDDLVNEDGKKVKKNSRVDIVELSAEADGEDLSLQMKLAGKIPDEISSNDQELNYLFVIATDDGGDYWVMLTNLEAGDWNTALTDYGSGYTSDESEFPGSLMPLDNLVVGRVPLSPLGDPNEIRVSAVKQRADHKTGTVLAEDEAPKGERYIPSDDWIVLR